MLPMLFRIKVRSTDASFGFFIPMLLLYILFIPIAVITALVYGFMLLAPAETRQARSYMKFIFFMPRLLSAARGTEIDVHSDDSDVKIFIK